MTVRYANADDLGLIKELEEEHVPEEELENIVKQNRVILAFESGRFAGRLRYGLFWDNIPFMNMLYVEEEFRGRGTGTKLVCFWESEMRKKGYGFVLTSTQSDEEGQFFYRKNGYRDVGNLILPDEVSEIILYKKLPETT